MNMPIPLTVAAPAVAAGAAYLNARLGLGHDYRLLGNAGRAQLDSTIRQWRNRLNVWYTLEDQALGCRANHPLIIFDGRTWTYREVYENSIKYGTWLKMKHGIKPKDIVAMNFINSEKFVFVWFGLWAIGAKPAFINYNLTGKALSHCIKVCSARLAVIDCELDGSITQELRDDLPGVEFEIFSPQVEAEVMSVQGQREPNSARSDDKIQNLAILIYTSGTTGLPKAAIVSWGKVILASGLVPPWMNFTKNDTFYTCMPLYHSAGAILGFAMTMRTGATCAIGKKFSTKTFWYDCRRANATAIQYVGETCRYLLAAPPEIDPETGSNLDLENKVRLAFGNGLRPDVWNRFKERFGIDAIAEFYSATEGATASWNYSRNDYSCGAIGRFGTIGSLLILPRVAIVEFDIETELPRRHPDTGLCIPVSKGTVGELLYKLDSRNIEKNFQGYFNNPSGTDSKIMRHVRSRGDAYFRTGDMITWDEENRIFFNDRIGDTFRWKSENVSTNEVAEALGMHPLVQEANVYGIELPHHDGRAGCVALMFKGSTPPTEQLMIDLAHHARAQLPRFAVPIFLRLVRNMEITGTMKQQKSVFRQQGVDPRLVGDDEVWWLKGNGDGYVKFSRQDWEQLNSGRVRL